MSGENKEKTNTLRKENDKQSTPDYGCVPSTFWYRFFGSSIVLNACRLIFGIKIRTDKEVRDMPGPMVVVGNHPSYIDPIIMGTLLYGRRINFVAGEFLFRKKIFGPIITKGGCIPKTQYRNDIRAVKAMMRVMKRGGTLGIFPEATRLIDGSSIRFDSALASLVKKSEAALVFMRSHGAYLNMPRWGQSAFRRGRITAEIAKVIPSDQIREMSVEEIHQAMLDTLKFNEYDYFKEHKQVFHSRKPAAGVENIANICPRCEGINTTFVPKDRRKKNLLVCRSCGNKVLLNDRGFFEPCGAEDKCFPDLHEWNLWEKKIYADMIEKPDFCLTEKVELHKECGEHDYAKVGEGLLTIRDGIITYEGTECEPSEGLICRKGKVIREHRNRDLSKVGKQVTKTFPIKNMKGILLDFGLFMEIYGSDSTVNRIVPENTQRIYEIYSIFCAYREKFRE
ncbi:MAG: 1-acyl-sn-glycerol-3-phosphate acyltransferase [Clostridiales bacterium]|nr:1-acyl-sn-glycerol-3-phosphate acyltransferase [Clostridiales bacterium]